LCLFAQELSQIHMGFHTQLLKAVTAGPQSRGRLGEVFLEFREHFLIYGDYCSNLPQAQALLGDLSSRNELFNQELLVSD
jgi:guanine nucleotide exchange factor VAV